jgi:hypothetical protein
LNQDKVVAVMAAALEEMLDAQKAKMVARLHPAEGEHDMCVTAMNHFIGKFGESMNKDDMMPFCWEKGVAKTDLMPRLKRVLGEEQEGEYLNKVFGQVLTWVKNFEEKQEKKNKKAEKEAARLANQGGNTEGVDGGALP